MPQVRVLGAGARITGGALCLLLALHTWIWVVRDVVELGGVGVWKSWVGSLALGGGSFTEMPATSSTDLGLGLLQLSAVFAAFTGAWTAGGLMTLTAALTFAYRLPVIWSVALHSESSPFYVLRGFDGDDALDVAAGTAVVAVLLSLVLAVVLLAGLRPWPRTPRALGGPAGVPGQFQPYGQSYGAGPYGAQAPHMAHPPGQPEAEPPLPSESPQRPAGAHPAVAALFLGVLVAFSIGWTIHVLATASAGVWLDFLTGRRTVFALLDVPPAWDWLTLAFLGGTGAVLALARTLSARGFTLGVALAVLPPALITLAHRIEQGTLFRLPDGVPLADVFVRVQAVITLVGAVTLILLTLRRGTAVEPPAPAPGGVPFTPPGAPVAHFPPQPGPANPYAAAPGPVPGAPPAYGYPAPPTAPPSAPPSVPPSVPPTAPPDGPGGGFGPPPSP